jgi:hypothetical protein
LQKETLRELNMFKEGKMRNIYRLKGITADESKTKDFTKMYLATSFIRKTLYAIPRRRMKNFVK